MKLVKYDQACKALAEAKAVDEVKGIRDKAIAMKAYAHQAKNRELEVDAAEIRMRAERRLGELIIAQKETAGLNPGTRTKGGGKGAGGSITEPPAIPTLAAAGIDKKLSSRAQKLAAVPEKKFEGMLGEWRERIQAENQLVTINLFRAGEKAQRKAEKAARKSGPLSPDRKGMFDVSVGDIKKLVCDQVNCIITDPPYSKEHLFLYSDLSSTAHRLLKDGGSCVVMVGHSYLPQVIQRLSEHLNYQWILAYLTPGGQSAQLWDRKVNTFWKPLLWFTKGKYRGDWIGDVCCSQPNDNDKRFHHWGQSESGMADIVMRFTNAGDTVLDPFCGGGTTGVVAVDLGRKFIGRDIEAKAVATTLKRLEQKNAA